MTQTGAKIIADSISPDGVRLTTLEVTLPRIVLAEFNTHRMFSRNSASSRAIPVEKMLKLVEENPYIPTHWGKNQKGMQAEEEIGAEHQRWAVREWLRARDNAMQSAKRLLGLSGGTVGVHKQITNRLLEPFMWHTVIVTSTEWANFFNLRCNPMAHPEIKLAAELMRDAMEKSMPTRLNYGQWHLPLVGNEDREAMSIYEADARVKAANNFQLAMAAEMEAWCKVSAGRCARVSYLTHDGKRDTQADIELHDRLLESGHMSPFEHVARPMFPDELELFKQPKMRWDPNAKDWVWVGERKEVQHPDGTYTWGLDGEYTHFLGNVQGWVTLRKMIPFEEDILESR